MSDLTSVFDDVDDGFLEVAFGSGFTFPFYGVTYTSVFLNTNGGMTFGAGNAGYDLGATEVTAPAIAVFWGDMDADSYGAATRPNQMRWRQSASCFQVAYGALQDFDVEAWTNTATLTLASDGEITVQYGSVGSEDILVGVFDGTHTADSYVAVSSAYDLGASGSGVVLFDAHGPGPTHGGQLTGRTIVYSP